MSDQFDLPEIAYAALLLVWQQVERVSGNNGRDKLWDSCYCTGEGPGINGLTVRPYNWGDLDDERPNIELNGVNFWFYKYFGRGMSSDKDWTPDQWAAWLKGALKIVYAADVR